MNRAQKAWWLMHSDGFVTAEISISRLQNHFPCDSKIGWSRAAYRLTAVSRVREKLVEKRLLGGKRRMGFPFKDTVGELEAGQR